MLYFTLPGNIRQALSILEAKGFESYAVGGSVRDMLMGKTPSDYDIASSARPHELALCFSDFRVIETGLRHGTVTVVIGGENIEITTFRVDGEYADNRHPETVSFTESVTLDLSRRDFTVNAMAYSPEKGLVDPFGGQRHLAEKKIVCVGDPDKRFGEDGLRILRALRFASVLGFEIGEKTAESIRANKSLLKNISAERIYSEFCKLLCGENACEVLLGFADVLCEFIPELACMIGFEQKNPYHCYDVFTHTAKAVQSSKSEKTLRLALFFHDFGKPAACIYTDTGQHFYGHARISAGLCERVLRRLKADNKTLRAVTELVSFHDEKLKPDEKSIRKFAAKTSIEFTRQLLNVKRADTLAHDPKCFYRLKDFDQIGVLLNKLEAEDACLTLRDLAVNGRDLMDMGMEQGEAVGKTLDTLYRMVVDGEIENERGKLLEEARRISGNV